MNSLHSILRVLALAGLSLLAGVGEERQLTPAARPPEPAVSYVAASPCSTDSLTLCLNSGRFQVRVNWRVPSQGTSGVGYGVALTGDTGYFWFFSPNNIELVLKVVDGRAFNGMFWVFYGALSNVEYTITVTDTSNGIVKTYTNPSGNLASVADTAAFAGGGTLRSDPGGEESLFEVSGDAAEAPAAGNSRLLPAIDVRQLASSEAACTPGDSTLCLNNGRFKVEVNWRVPAQGTSGKGTAVPLTGDTGQFWFFSSNNIELVIKVLDGTPVNGQYWVFYGALSNVEYTIKVTDTLTGYEKTFVNPSGNLASVADTSGFSAAVTPTSPPGTPTPAPTPTPTPPSGGTTHIVNVGPGGTNAFRDTTTDSSTTNIKVGDTVQWNFVTTNYHSATSGTCTSDGDPYYGYVNCNPDGTFDSGQQITPGSYSKKFTTAGSFPYFCSVHGQMMTGTVIVSP